MEPKLTDRLEVSLRIYDDDDGVALIRAAESFEVGKCECCSPVNRESITALSVYPKLVLLVNSGVNVLLRANRLT